VKCLYAAADLIEAQLFKDMLKESGIVTEIFNQNARAGTGEIPFTHAYPELWLRNESDESRARELLREFENRPMPTGVTICSQCREENPANFASCWQCGKMLGLGSPDLI
jgi:Putative prokaryotic signal transducing protein